MSLAQRYEGFLRRFSGKIDCPVRKSAMLEAAKLLGDQDREIGKLRGLVADKDQDVERLKVELAGVGAAIETATYEEAERWANRLNWLHTEYGADCSWVDSGDQLDCVEGEIRQALNKQKETFGELVTALEIAQKELDGLWSFWGRNLEVHNWHLNGASEPFDRFFEDNDHGAKEAVDSALTKAKEMK